jgi:hypothetical protein
MRLSIGVAQDKAPAKAAAEAAKSVKDPDLTLAFGVCAWTSGASTAGFA